MAYNLDLAARIRQSLEGFPFLPREENVWGNRLYLERKYGVWDSG